MRKKMSDVLSTISVYSLLIMLTVSICVIGYRLATIDGSLNRLQTQPQTKQIVVQPGDTLWAIAKAESPETDPRDMIGQIVQLNELGSAKIYPGQVLTLPEKQQSVPLQLADLNNR
ncbi:MAG: LysM peptidoglycan-binding domain-containing protein [Firmicutes bacterium]|jgi:nucleoid-associated protein YgaU|nr:LysM peptidoglycan-binding domain-containing protein [Bacillota bacterium]